MTHDFRTAIELHEKLRTRACRLFELEDDTLVGIALDGDEAVVRWPTIEYGYEAGDECVSDESERCPQSLLFAADDAFDAALPEWHLERRARQIREAEAAREQQARNMKAFSEALMRQLMTASEFRPAPSKD